MCYGDFLSSGVDEGVVFESTEGAQMSAMFFVLFDRMCCFPDVFFRLSVMSYVSVCVGGVFRRIPWS